MAIQLKAGSHRKPHPHSVKATLAASLTHNCCFDNGPASSHIYSSLLRHQYVQSFICAGIWADITRTFFWNEYRYSHLIFSYIQKPWQARKKCPTKATVSVTMHKVPGPWMYPQQLHFFKTLSSPQEHTNLDTKVYLMFRNKNNWMIN